MKSKNRLEKLDLDLIQELNAKDSEMISGGKKEKFTIENHTTLRIPYVVDGQETTYPYGGSISTWTVEKGGEIKFDYDSGLEGTQLRKYNLSDGGKYAFQYDTRTPYKDDIDLFKIA